MTTAVIEAPMVQSPAPAVSAPWPSERAGWYCVAVLTLSLLANFLDRGIIALLVPQIKADLQLSDTQLSLVMGFAFVMFYMVAGLPIARYADIGVRTRLIAIGMALWGGATALTGFARSFAALFAFRVGVGVGEACTGPASFSLLGDYFRPERLPRAIAVLNFGFILGNGLALLIGGSIVAALAAGGPYHLPMLGEFKAWQVTLMIVGLPGLVVSLLMLTVKEPPRRVQGEAPSIPEVLKFLYDNRWLYGPLVVGISLNTIVMVAHASWGPAVLMRRFGWEIGEIGLFSGLTFMLLMPPGAILGSLLAERWMKKGIHDANLRVSLIAFALSMPLLGISPLMPTGAMSVALVGIAFFISAFMFGPQNAAIQMVTPNRMRGQVTALVLFGFNVLGYGLGPTVLALITDYIYKDENQIHLAMATCYAMISPIAFGILCLALKPYRERVKAIEAEMGATS